MIRSLRSAPALSEGRAPARSPYDGTDDEGRVGIRKSMSLRKAVQQHRTPKRRRGTHCAMGKWNRVGLLAAWVMSVAAMTHGEESALPVAFGAARYEGMRQNCPFALTSAVPPPKAAQASFAANWYVSGIARVGDADFVCIKARDLSSQFTLYGRERDPRTGVAVVGVEWVAGIGKSVVTIEKDGEKAKLEFNESVVRGPAQPAGTIATGEGKASPVSSTPVGGAAPATSGVGARPIPIGGANGGATQRYLRTVPLPIPAPNGANAAVRPPGQGPNSGVPRPILPGTRPTGFPQNQPGR